MSEIAELLRRLADAAAHRPKNEPVYVAQEKLHRMGFDAFAPEGLALARGYADALEALEAAHNEADLQAECWRIGCLRDQNHAGERSNANAEVLWLTGKALTKAEETLRPLVGSE